MDYQEDSGAGYQVIAKKGTSLYNRGADQLNIQEVSLYVSRQAKYSTRSG